MNVYDDYPKVVEDLASTNMGMCDFRMDSIPPKRACTDVIGNYQFGKAQIPFQWGSTADESTHLDRSYFSMRLKISGADGQPLDKRDNIAINMGCPHSMFDKMEYKMNDKTVERISQHYAQIAAMRKRLTNTGDWLSRNGRMGNWEDSFALRQEKIIHNGMIPHYGGKWNDDGPIIKSRTEIGIAAATTISFATFRITFAGSADNQSNFEQGDWIAIQVNDNDIRVFVVIGVAGANVLDVGYLDEAEDIADANLTFWRLRFCNINVMDREAIDLAVANTGNIAFGQQEIDMDPPNILNGDFLSIFRPFDAVPEPDVEQARVGGLVAARVDEDTVKIYSFDQITAVTAEDTNNFNSIRYSNSHFVESADMGFTDSHTVSLEVPAVGEKQILVFATASATSSPLPNLRQLFKKGDFIGYTINGNNNPCVAMVWQVDPSNDGASLWVVGSKRAATEMAENALNRVLWRFRIGSEQNSLSIENDAEGYQYVEIPFVPALSVFNLPHTLPNSCKHELILTPLNDAVYPIKAIQSNGVAKVHGTDFIVLVDSLIFHPFISKGPRIDSIKMYLDLQTTECVSLPITTGNKQQYQCDVSNTVNAITVALQDSSAETSSLYPNTMFKIRNELDLKMTEFYIKLSGLQRPLPEAVMLYDEATGTNLYINQYFRNFQETGSAINDTVETFHEWKRRGPYYHFSTPRTGTDRSTSMVVSLKFTSGSLFVDNGDIKPNLLVFHHSMKAVRLLFSEGKLVDVRYE